MIQTIIRYLEGNNYSKHSCFKRKSCKFAISYTLIQFYCFSASPLFASRYSATLLLLFGFAVVRTSCVVHYVLFPALRDYFK